MKSRGVLIVVSGPSGAGKNTVLNAVMPLLHNIRYSVSVTTRPARIGEQEGVDYFFVDDDRFNQMIANHDLLEWAQFCDHRYGTPRSFVNECLARGESVITDLDIQGARQIRQSDIDAVFVFLLPPSLTELKKRLVLRGTEAEEAIRHRLKTANEELPAIVDYDYWLLNDSLDSAAADLHAIVRAEQLRVQRLDVDGAPHEAILRGVLL